MNQPDDQQEPNEFAAFLLLHNKGRTHDELTETLAKVVAAVAETGKPGALQLTLKVSPAKGVDGMVRVDDDVKSKVPALDRGASLFFVTEGGGLSQEHPGQTSIFSIQGDQNR